MERVEDIKRPLKKGEVFLVPCIVRTERIEKDEQEIWMDLNNGSSVTKRFICPIINHPHNDVENGQRGIHYHLDYRFFKHNNDDDFPSVPKNQSYNLAIFDVRPRPEHGQIEYIALPVINEEFTGTTPTAFIQNSKLKHKCIHKGKCPHRGYDLSQVKSKNGIIKCPLHGLQFIEETGELTNYNPDLYK